METDIRKIFRSFHFHERILTGRNACPTYFASGKIGSISTGTSLSLSSAPSLPDESANTYREWPSLVVRAFRFKRQQSCVSFRTPSLIFVLSILNLPVASSKLDCQMFRSVRFGLTESHARGGYAVKLLTDEAAIKFDEATGKFSIDNTKIREGVRS